VGGIQANISHPVDFLVENLDMGRNIVLAAREAGVPRLVNLGSSCMYPRDRLEALTEDLILKGELEPTNEGYALAKVMTMRLCEYVTKENSALQYKTLIPCNLYGRHDKFDPAHSHLIPAIIHKVSRQN
jgi:GDP-L-fucose synthase